MYRARDAVDNSEWVEDLESAAAELDLSPDAVSTARDMFLSSVPESDRSKRALVAASIYAGALVAGDQRSQTAVADAAGVTRLSVQSHWKRLLRNSGFEAPDW